MTPCTIVLVGAPGAGKGTQATMLSQALDMPHVASGDLFRDNLRRKTELGLRAKTYMDAGELVPDDVTVAMIEARIAQADCARGAILDGFPRTVSQAEALDCMLAARSARLRAVLYVEVPERELINRLGGRFVCRNCQATFHAVFSPPRQQGRCDVCGGELYQRPDDAPDTVRQRLQVYLEQTAPLIDYYHRKGILRKVDGAESIEAVHRAMCGALNVNGTQAE